MKILVMSTERNTTFPAEKSVKFQLKFSENKDVFFPP